MTITKYDTTIQSKKQVTKRGLDVINDPRLNKGTAFPYNERDQFGLRGLVPPRCTTIETQVQRVMGNYYRKTDPLEKFVFLSALHGRNECLFYRVLLENLEEMTPVIYTPTVGLACQKFGALYRRTRGMYFSVEDKGMFRKMMDNWPENEISVIVVTDGSRILGLGDLGANGMGIPVGKLSLYVAAGGIYPNRTLPVLIDVGTNNQDLLNDPLYLGINKTRLTGEKYNELMDEFVEGVQDRWPGALIQFEDFTNDHAFYLLEKYRHQMLCFNDDIQGTGAVALAGLLGALRIAGGKLEDQKIVFLGAGTAAVGIANMIVAGIVEESGIRPEEARKQLWFLDSKGLITTRRGDTLKAHKIPYARDMEFIPTLTEVIRKVKPTVLMGLSGQANSFTETVIKEMARHVKRPIIFALSNPTSKAECTARQAYTWTDGKAVFASGSPFEPVEHKGQMYVPGQGNNMFIFPGVGLGLVACGAKKVTDSMFYTAARTLAKRVTDTDLHQGTVYPGLKRIRQITESIATAVCRVAYKEGLATVPVPDDILSYIQNQMYHPAYAVYESDS